MFSGSVNLKRALSAFSLDSIVPVFRMSIRAVCPFNSISFVVSDFSDFGRLANNPAAAIFKSSLSPFSRNPTRASSLLGLRRYSTTPSGSCWEKRNNNLVATSRVSESGSSRRGRTRDTPLMVRTACLTNPASNLQIPRSARKAGLRTLQAELGFWSSANKLVTIDSNSS
ncbi:hypothetical protein TorRG33x02_239010 [Trema orientale]|uniref:Uncharacterized protein n=1 Tax=Trema orientale TaxID=63057 RepID=A0A2P5DXQ4_TREOI|nr:hypothetical protein TorRG33x02_239010 [Trema orientale]